MYVMQVNVHRLADDLRAGVGDRSYPSAAGGFADDRSAR